MPKTANAKPEIEAVMREALSGEVLENALSLVAHLRERGMNPLWSATNAWKISYKSFSVCFIRLFGAAEYYKLRARQWHIVPFIGEYDAGALDDEQKEIVWANKHTCESCGRCALKLAHVFGRQYDYACEKAVIFTNPDEKTVKCAEKLIELRRNAIKEGKAEKHKYVALKDR